MILWDYFRNHDIHDCNDNTYFLCVCMKYNITVAIPILKTDHVIKLFQKPDSHDFLMCIIYYYTIATYGEIPCPRLSITTI